MINLGNANTHQKYAVLCGILAIFYSYTNKCSVKYIDYRGNTTKVIAQLFTDNLLAQL